MAHLMLPTPRLFRSRWFALAWAVGVIWFAIDIATSTPQDAPANGDEAAQVAIAVNALGN